MKRFAFFSIVGAIFTLVLGLVAGKISYCLQDTWKTGEPAAGACADIEQILGAISNGVFFLSEGTRPLSVLGPILSVLLPVAAWGLIAGLVGSSLYSLVERSRR